MHVFLCFWSAWLFCKNSFGCDHRGRSLVHSCSHLSIASRAVGVRGRMCPSSHVKIEFFREKYSWNERVIFVKPIFSRRRLTKKKLNVLQERKGWKFHYLFIVQGIVTAFTKTPSVKYDLLELIGHFTYFCYFKVNCIFSYVSDNVLDYYNYSSLQFL